MEIDLPELQTGSSKEKLSSAWKLCHHWVFIIVIRTAREWKVICSTLFSRSSCRCGRWEESSLPTNHRRKEEERPRLITIIYHISSLGGKRECSLPFTCAVPPETHPKLITGKRRKIYAITFSQGDRWNHGENPSYQFLSSAIVRNSEPGRERQDYGVDWWDFTEPIVSVDFCPNDNRSVIIFRTLLPGIELRRPLRWISRRSIESISLDELSFCRKSARMESDKFACNIACRRWWEPLSSEQLWQPNQFSHTASLGKGKFSSRKFH